MKYIMTSLALVLLTVGLVVGCTPKSSNNNNSAAGLNPGQLYQTPSISGTLTPLGGGSSSNISNLLGSSYSISGVLAPATLTLDLSGSSSNGPPGTTVSGSVAIAAGGTATSLGGLKWALSFTNPILASVTITLTDSLGLASIITFNIPVTCDPSKLKNGPITFSASPITVTAGSSGAGYVNVSVAAPTGGSGAGFMYAIDVNGDGRFDDYNNQYWNSSPSWTNLYTLYNGTRNVKITAIDTQCQVEQTVIQAVNFLPILPAIQSGATALPESYYYLQGVVASTSGSTDTADNVNPYDAMDPGTSGTHVRCGYNYGSNGQGSLVVTSYNIYSDGAASNQSELYQGMTLGFNVPLDTGGVGTVTQTSTPITTLTYQTSQSPDGSLSGTKYTNASGATCNATAVIVKTPSQGTCATIPGNQLMMIQMSGTFSCSSLTNGGNPVKTESVNSGYFYCQYDTANNCVGGGQEGGNPPPPF